MKRPSFRCFVIGSDTLLMECTDHLLEAGHAVLGVVTDTQRISDWASDRGLRVVDPQHMVEAMAEEPFDHLFAITWLRILPDTVLELPTGRAINFHDGPLPAYAGLNAPAWALLKGADRYGVTWHLMTSGVDQGDIVAQSPVALAQDETALSLNMKCFAAARDGFPALVAQLADGELVPIPQESSERSWFGPHDRPDLAGLLDWSRPAAELERHVRALDFGPYPNPLARPKLATRDGRAWIVSSARAEPLERAAEPGVVVEVRGEDWVIATGAGALVVTGRLALTGQAIDATREATNPVAVGARLLRPTPDEADALRARIPHMARNEAFWSRRLRGMQPPELPDRRPSDPSEPGRLSARVPLTVPPTASERIGFDGETILIAAWAVVVARLGRTRSFDLGWVEAPSSESDPAAEIMQTLVAPWRPFRVDLGDEGAGDRPFGAVAQVVEAEVARMQARGPFLIDVMSRHPKLADRFAVDASPLPVAISRSGVDGAGAEVSLELAADGGAPHLAFDPRTVDPERAETLARAIEAVLNDACAEPEKSWTSLSLVDAPTRRRLLDEWNATARDVDDRLLHDAFEEQARRHPDRTALRDRGRSLSYADLDRRANGVAVHLRRLGVGPDTIVGLRIERSIDLVVAALGVVKAGGAYLPLDPDFPEDRLSFMLADAGARWVVTADDAPQVEGVDTVDMRGLAPVDQPPRDTGLRPADLAYVIYTSGSTGRPKGVLVEHRNVANFFAGMDDVVAHDPPGVWLAVTSLSFDISVLELFWTLSRGFEVVLHHEPAVAEARAGEAPGATAPVGASAAAHDRLAQKGMQFGLFMWGNDDGPGRNKYRLMLEAGRYFDDNGFDSAWTPERHFHAFGGPFPNPSVTGAALAAVTKNLAIRSGSCVSPLHHPIRIAEEWAVVDNLSDGRVGLSFAAGWQPNDFVLRPENHSRQKAVMMEQIDVVRRLWRGEAVEFENPLGKMVPLTTLPRPVQPELPFWITTAGNPETYRTAGRMGANVLTHLLGQSFDEVAVKIAAYRQARAEAGLDPAAGTVTLMLHTFVGTDNDEVRELVREPMKDYLRASMKLVLGFAWTFPAFKRPGGVDSTPDDVDLASLSDEETEAILDFAFDRYYETSGLFGTPETCLDIVARCAEIGVDEIACLLDFGVDTDAVLGGLPQLKAVRDAANTGREIGGEVGAGIGREIGAEIGRDPMPPVTHLQCTPSMARLFVERPEMVETLRGLDQMFVGGEAFPEALAATLRKTVQGSVRNMYGPTETTIWSTTHPVDADGAVPIGRPIANTQIYILDPWGEPVPPGLPGDLWIGGAGVVRGYHERPDLNAERFRPNPFAEGRMYCTGDQARWTADGVLDFLGRVDDQVKIRGYRIELGEIEAVLDLRDDVKQSAVIVREDTPGDQRLVGYVVADDPWDPDAMRADLGRTLPPYMVPGQLVRLDALPLTPNRKTDRKALLAISAAPTRARPVLAPANDLEATLVEAWKQVLGIAEVGTDDNFFDAGGHSLLVVQLHRLLSERLDSPLSLIDLYRWPTIRSLSEQLMSSTDAGGASDALDASAARGARRRDMMRRRRGG